MKAVQSKGQAPSSAKTFIQLDIRGCPCTNGQGGTPPATDHIHVIVFHVCCSSRPELRGLQAMYKTPEDALSLQAGLQRQINIKMKNQAQTLNLGEASCLRPSEAP